MKPVPILCPISFGSWFVDSWQRVGENHSRACLPTGRVSIHVLCGR